MNNKISSKKIREDFINFFKQLDHKYVHSTPVVPYDDPTLLFTNAGMNQFKDVFLNTGKRNYTRAVNFQKCIRVSGKHNDLEEVGIDTYHHTFFEMLGNWSFGDYYKHEAIQWAWKLLTEVWQLPKEKLYATVYKDDDEALDLWKTVTDINHSHILKFGEKENFWEMGESGPCGPCSELHFDLGEQIAPGDPLTHVNGTSGRVIEIWNLVFIQYNRDENGKLHTLPAKHVDTGMGFERITSILQGKQSNYDTDIFQPVIQEIAKLSNHKYGEDIKHDIAMRVIADHIRAIYFSIADGCTPSNEGRGYVIRRILRRACRFGRNLGLFEPFLYKLSSFLHKLVLEDYPENSDKIDNIYKIIKKEEESFNETLDRGLKILDEIIVNAKNKGDKVISGVEAFKLYDTFGFPLDLTQLIGREQSMEVDVEGFNSEMNQQKQRGKNASKFVYTSQEVEWAIMTKEHVTCQFIGYDELESNSTVIKWNYSDNVLRLVTDKTPFYAESGGQVGDIGTCEISGQSYEVINTIKVNEDIIHIIKSDIPITLPKTVLLKVNKDNREMTRRNHSATHLLHAGLRKVLGTGVTQAGSLVEPTRLRFDFNVTDKPTTEQLNEIEKFVNEKIYSQLSVSTNVTSLEKAKSEGVMALFGEKYGEVVRVVKIDGVSAELCGGTHVQNTSSIGVFFIVSESNIAAGIRRIEAVTGPSAYAMVHEQRNILNELRHNFNTTVEELPKKVISLIDNHKKLEKEMKKLKSTGEASSSGNIIGNVEVRNGINCVVQKTNIADVNELRGLGDLFRSKVKNGVMLLGNVAEGRLNFIVAVTDDLIQQKKYDAVTLVNQVAKIADGKGGGKPHLALAGGKNIDKVDEALNIFNTLI